jgi:thiamine pyrophosphate-dependent acetolactate synthase large subunit-like protein
VPAAIGAKIRRAHRQVIALVGDGSFFGAQALGPRRATKCRCSS